MYLKKLEIVGFKSFLNKTTLHFEPGITAVVGPNGCGKSNIFDSIRWVLGEQSVKALRGSKMEDVIFNGTDNKEPLSLAEVSLTFSNENRLFPIDDNEFVITRRIFRSGESEYLLNKAIVRLKDINELFLGTGVGAEAYSLIEQGKIDLILSSRPEERRMVFDEASGITKYKSQKKEALRRLEETEQNLLRINDIIAEVKRQIGSLERQANKARRYKEVFEELKSKEIRLAVVQAQAISGEKISLINKIKKLEATQQVNYQRIGEIESEIKEKNLAVKELEDKAMGIKNEILGIDNLIARNNQHEKLNRERIDELKSLKESLKEQITQIEKRIESDIRNLDNFKTEYASLKSIRDENNNLLGRTEEAQGNIVHTIKSSHDKINQCKKEILEIVNKQSVERNSFLELSARIQSHLARKKRLEIEKAKILEERTSLDSLVNKINLELNGLNANFEDFNHRLLTSKKEQEDEKQLLDELRQEIQELEKNKAKLISQKDFLDKLKLRYEEEAEAMNAVVFIEGVPQESPSGLVIKIKEGRALDDKDRQLTEKVDYKFIGEAKPIPLNTESIEQKIIEVSNELDNKINQKREKDNLILDLSAKITELEQKNRESEILLNNKRAEHKNILEQFAKISEENDIVEMELHDVNQEISDLKIQEQDLNQRLTVLEEQSKNQEDLIRAEQETINSLNAKREDNLVLIAQIKTELSSLDKRLVSEKDTLKTLEDAYQQNQVALADYQSQVKESEQKNQLLHSEIEKLINANKQAVLDKEKMREGLSNFDCRNKELSANLEAADNELAKQRSATEEVKTDLYNLQMQNQELDFKTMGLKERILQAYKVELDDFLNQQEGIVSDQVDEPLDSLSQQIKTLKDKIDSYGTVNLVAIEEYDELKTRYDFLNQQQTDLLTAKESLHEAILKINRTTKKMFIETFEKIAVEFRNYFRLLFGGGDASVFLVNDTDPLESGIEIICRPPGKKLQNVLLLSGGEKSLSAIALLFSIFKIKPSPFCVLDEIDAALDEANVDRYGRLLHDFTKSSQFIVITHNKRTIANADIMYGITMEESGVSKIVSVKFSKGRIREQESVEETSAVAA